MDASIIAIGTEMLGPIRVDTNSLKVTAALERYGVKLARKSIVGDTLDDVVDEIRFSLDHSDILITSGGLGPTEDDLTRDALAKALALEFDVDQSIVEKIEARFRARGWKMPEVNRRQANVFRGQTTLYNERGTAPGFHLVVDGGVRTSSSAPIVPRSGDDQDSMSNPSGRDVRSPRTRHVWVFPGVPHELEWMLATYFVPWLQQQSGGRGRQRRILKIAGLTESGVEEKLKPYYDAHPGEPVTILASPSGIEVHVIAEADIADADAFIAGREKELLAIFGQHVFGYDEESLEAVVGRILTERNETVATAESCTGGLLSARLTDVPGSSRYFMGGAVCYTADAKITMASVDPELIRAHGEVSEEVAMALARGIRERFGTTYGVGITGIAGPGGGTAEKPVGTVHIAVASAEAIEHRKLTWPNTRRMIRAHSTQMALDVLRRMITR